MDNPKPPSFLSILPTAIILSLAGWGGLAAVVLYTLPTLGPRWLFFFLCMVALTGTVLPVVYFFNRRFPTSPPAEGGVLLRQAMWFGVYGSALTWLQLGRMFSITVAGILAVALLIVESLLRMREVSQWKPKG